MTLTLDAWLELSLSERVQARSRVLELAARATETHHAYISVGDDTDWNAQGKLAGVPFAVKDNIDVAGRDTTAGSPALIGDRADIDADAVSLLRDAGAVVVGKANLHELALGATSNNAAFGPVRNPLDPTRTAGGSSGGSAAAVALGTVPFSLGTDTGGSVTVPSAFCGITGFRPTVGRYPGTGVVNLSTTRDTIGVHARCVKDIQLVDSVLAGSGRGQQSVDLSDLVLGRVVSRCADLEGEVDRVFTTALGHLQSCGVTVVDVDVVDDLKLAGSTGEPMVSYEAKRLLPLRAHGGVNGWASLAELADAVASPDVAAIVRRMAADDTSPREYDEYRRRRWDLRRRYERSFADSGVHALVAPTVPILPPLIGEDDTVDVDGARRPTFATIIRNTGPGTLAGLPMLTVPAGTSSNGLPVGMCVEGRPHGDDAVLAIALAIESAFDLRLS